MAEEKKTTSRRGRKPAAPKSEAPKVEQAQAPKAVEEKAAPKAELSEGDLVKDLDGKEYVYVRPSRKERIVVKEKDSDIEIVINKDLLIK